MTSIKFSTFKTERIDFIVFNSPNQDSIDDLNKAIDSYNIQLIFRLCKPLYDSNLINSDKCQIIDMQIADGSFPSEIVINDYLTHIKNHIKFMNDTNCNIKPCVGIHCTAGLGRAPVFAAIGLMNYSTYDDCSDIIKLIREKIDGSINSIQLTELSKYKPKKKNKCIIS